MSIYSQIKLFILLLLGLNITVLADVAHNKTLHAKPHAPVEMSFNITKNIDINDLAILTINLTNTIDTNNLQVIVNPDTVLQINYLLPSYDFQVLPNNTKSTIQLEVSSENPGIFYIYLTAYIENTSRTQSRNFVIPINIGNVDAQKYLQKIGTAPVTDSTGRQIISLPGKVINLGGK